MMYKEGNVLFISETDVLYCSINKTLLMNENSFAHFKLQCFLRLIHRVASSGYDKLTSMMQSDFYLEVLK